MKNKLKSRYWEAIGFAPISSKDTEAQMNRAQRRKKKKKKKILDKSSKT